jgi:hypothetical protein
VGNYNSIWKLSQAWFHERLILQNHLILHQTSIVLLAPRRQIMGLHAKYISIGTSSSRTHMLW